MCGIINGIFGGGGQPDTSGMNAAAVQQAALSREQLDWAKQIYAETAPDRADAIQRAKQVSDAQLESMNLNNEISKDYNDYQKGTFRPLEKQLVDDANNFDTAQRREEAAAQASADVEMSLGNVQSQQSRQLARSGVNPASGEAIALSSGMGIEKAKALAGASNKARKDIELQGFARKMDAASLGRGLASSQATSAGVALSAGNSSVGNAQAPGAINSQGNQIMTQGFAGAQQGLAGAASTFGNIGSLQNSAFNNETQRMKAMTDIGMMAMSDKKAKKDIKPASSKASLAAFRKMPVSHWKYKKGRGDGGRHTGPMAQDVRKGLGEKTAPDGKVVDLISMAGHTINAIKELDKRVAGLESGRRRT